MSTSTTRWLLNVHRWCGLIVSANLFVMALTGIILVYHDEIDQVLGVGAVTSQGPNRASLGDTIALARASQPGSHAVYLFADEASHPGVAFVGLSKTSRRLGEARPVAVDRRSGRVLPQLDLQGTFTNKVLKLHAELFMGSLGRLLIGLVALALLVSLTSGAIIYGPLMKRFAFGLLRRDRSRRTFLADLHKLLGATTFGWLLLVAATGLFLSLGSVVLQFYSATELAALGAPYRNDPIVEDLQTVDAAVDQAERAAKGPRWSIVSLPGSDLASPRHYGVLLKGGPGMQSRMLTLAMVDAKTPSSASVQDLPLYLKALLLSEPLHFGDYGGGPLKVIWVLFGLATLGLSGSGVWAFFTARGDRSAKRSSRILDEEGGVPAP